MIRHLYALSAGGDAVDIFSHLMRNRTGPIFIDSSVSTHIVQFVLFSDVVIVLHFAHLEFYIYVGNFEMRNAMITNKSSNIEPCDSTFSFCIRILINLTFGYAPDTPNRF